MDPSLEELFGALKKCQSSQIEGNTKSLPETQENKKLDSDFVDFEDNKKDTEKIFRDIELNLQKLPKLNNEFDKLSNKKTKPTVNNIDDKANTKKASDEDKDWFLMPKANDKTRKDIQRDLLLIKHRAALDPKRHYKKQKWQVPERFSVGTIIEDKTEFYSSRINKKDRKSTMLESFMGDDESNKYFKRKYNEIQVQKTSGKRGHFKKNKAMRKKY